jgi:hypothetical protein
MEEMSMSYELEKNIKQVFKDNPNPELEFV